MQWRVQGRYAACTNQAESWFSRLRRAEIGQHHRISGRYLYQYPNEMAWREGQPARLEWNQFQDGNPRRSPQPEERDMGRLLATESGGMTTDRPNTLAGLVEKR